MSETDEDISRQINALVGDGSELYLRFPYPENKPHPPTNGYEFRVSVNSYNDTLLSLIRYNNNDWKSNIFVETSENPMFDDGSERNKIALIEWLVLHIWIDSQCIDEDSAMKQVNNINDDEFNGAGSILRDGNHIWILVRIPKIELMKDRSKYLAKLHAYLLRLSKKWNIVRENNLVLEIDSDSVWPKMSMPVTGTMDYFYDSPCMVKWIIKGVFEPQDEILSEVMKTGHAYCQTGMTHDLSFREFMRRYKSIMISDNTFSAHSFQEYLSKTDRHRFRFYNWKSMNGRKHDIEIVIFLRLIFHASPAVIAQILSMYCNASGNDGSRPFGDYRSYVDRLILKADYFIARLLSALNLKENMMRGSFPSPNPSSVFSAGNEVPSLDGIREALITRFGPEIHFAGNDIYIVRTQRGPRDSLYQSTPWSKRKSYFVSIPCSLISNLDRTVNGRGVLLVRSEIAESLIGDINRLPVERLIVIYFWFHATRYLLFPVPSKFVSSDEILSWLKRYHPEILKNDKIHSNDRTRKNKIDDDMEK